MLFLEVNLVLCIVVLKLRVYVRLLVNINLNTIPNTLKC